MELPIRLCVLGMMCLLMAGQATADRLDGIERKLQQMGHQFKTLQGENQHLRRKLNEQQKTITGLQETTSQQEKTITGLQKRTDEQQETISQQHQTITGLQKTSNKQDQTITELQENDNKHQRTISRMQEMNNRQQKTFSNQQHMITKLLDGNNKQQEINDELQTAIQTVQTSRLMGNITRNIASGFVAFRVDRTANMGPVSEPTTVIYDNVNFNYGAGYEPTTGTFTTPIAGIYLFTTIHRYEGFHLHVEVNGLNILNNVGAAAATYNTDPSMSSSLLLQLSAGDIVTVVLDSQYSSAQIYCVGFNDCQFSGVLLQQIL